MTPANHAPLSPLDAIRRCLEAVTPGQWATGGPWQGAASVVSVDEGIGIWDVCWLRERDVYHPQRDIMADAEFIARAPQDMAALLAVVDLAVKAIEPVCDDCAEVDCDCLCQCHNECVAARMDLTTAVRALTREAVPLVNEDWSAHGLA